MESESPAGFERELQNFTMMTWEYYRNEKKQGNPDAVFAIYVLWLKVKCRTVSITNTPCLQYLMHNITTSQEHNIITVSHNWAIPKDWREVHLLSIKRPSVTSICLWSASTEIREWLMLLLPLIAYLINSWLQRPFRGSCSSPMITKMPHAVEMPLWVYSDPDTTLCYCWESKKQSALSCYWSTCKPIVTISEHVQMTSSSCPHMSL